jgi:hypothetical protein
MKLNFRLISLGASKSAACICKPKFKIFYRTGNTVHTVAQKDTVFPSRLSGFSGFQQERLEN